ncbi:MAG: RluA family pseudouridine synthase [Candidatus Liptonbacteria bacterium]|nr:RluA family pseudouridine synthase [Candidatus Liptonbacteria bacterium]
MNEVSIIYEDKDFLALNKPAGLLVHPSRFAEAKARRAKIPKSRLHESTLTEWLIARYPEIKNVGDLPAGRQATPLRPGIVHRLDKETSGILLVAKNQKCFDYLKLLFQEHKIKKTYLALVFGKVTSREGNLSKSIGIKKGTIKRTVHSLKFLKDASTDYRVKEYLKIGEENFSLLELRPQTGRTHQIRVHLSSINHPVVGDRLYGRKLQPNWVSRLMLHAYSLEFSQFQGGRIKLEAEPPEDFQSIIHNLKII